MLTVADLRLHLNRIFLLACAIYGAAVLVPSTVHAAEGDLPGPLRDVGFDQNLGQALPLDATFVDEGGREVRLGDFFHDGRPVVLALVYYECPMLCDMVLNGLVSSLDILTFQPGKDYEVVVVSFDPTEDAVLAANKKREYLVQFDREGAREGMHFLTGESPSIDALTRAVGFRYVYDEEKDQYAHAAGVTVATPEGEIARYLFGIEYAPKDLRLALVEAAQMRIGSAVDQLLLFCYNYDPVTGKYGAATMRMIQIGGALTIGALALFILLSRRRDRRSISPSTEDLAHS